jgi:hypothetical protein
MLGWIAVFPVAGFLFADYLGFHLIFFAREEKGLLGWSSLVCKFLIFGTLLLNGASLVYLLITEAKDRSAIASKIETEKARTEIETAARMKLIEAQSAARRAEETQRAENAAKLLAATGNARLARVVTTTVAAQPIAFGLTVTPSPTPGPESTASKEAKTKEAPSTFERFIRWYTRAPLYFSGGLVGLVCFCLIQVFGKLDADRKVRESPEGFPTELDVSEKRSPTRRAGFVTAPENAKTHVSSKIIDAGAARKKTLVSLDGLRGLRETLKEISFYHPGMSFKADVKDDCVWIRAMASDHGMQRTTHSARAHLAILDDVLTMDRAAFTSRLVRYLQRHGFEIKKVSV